MTDPDREPFAKVITRLALAHREPPLDTPRLRLYFDALRDLPLEFVTMAADQLEKHTQYFPKVSEWRKAVSAIEARRRREQAELIRKRALRGEWLCTVCEDKGWAGDPAQTVRRCDCQELRRLELLGRRPWPQLSSLSDEESQS